jgi:diketogulonate reductase-like aldo/keto reductase
MVRFHSLSQVKSKVGDALGRAVEGTLQDAALVWALEQGSDVVVGATDPFHIQEAIRVAKGFAQ